MKKEIHVEILTWEYEVDDNGIPTETKPRLLDERYSQPFTTYEEAMAYVNRIPDPMDEYADVDDD